MFATLSETFWVLVLAIVVLFAFFAALGAFQVGEVMALTFIVIVLALLWVAHAMWDTRHRDPAGWGGGKIGRAAGPWRVHGDMRREVATRFADDPPRSPRRSPTQPQFVP